MENWKDHIGDTFEIKVTPKASSNKVKAEFIEGRLLLKVYITAPPEDGKANKAVIELLAKELKIPKKHLSILKGEHSRNKVVKVRGER